MIISFKHKFIFIKSRKTGGTSVQVALSKFCGPDDIILGELEENGIINERYGAGKNIDKFFTDNPHPTSDQIKNWIISNGYNWNEFYKFTIVRNPLDIIVSRYHWDIEGKANEKTNIIGFNNWVGEYIQSGRYEQDMLTHYITDCYFMMHYENLEEDYKKVCNDLKLPYEKLSNLKGKYRKNKPGFWHYYGNRFNFDLVLNKVKPVCDLLGYNYFKPDMITTVSKRFDCIYKYENLPDLNNINGPSVIKIPEYIKKDFGIEYTYQMFFAHHQGTYIRTAYSNNPFGPWKYIQNDEVLKTLQLENTYCDKHIASPDVHVDNTILRMYYHGDMNEKQYSFFTTSIDGINFYKRDIMKRPLGHFYFRVFDYFENRYAIAKKGNDCGIIYQFDWELEQYIPKAEIIPNMRHCSVYIKDNILYIFYSLIGDLCEHIRCSALELDKDITNWCIINDQRIMSPIEKWEGATEPQIESKPGSVYNLVNQLRDPYLFEDIDGKTYLYYSYGGESGIGCVQLTINY